MTVVFIYLQKNKIYIHIYNGLDSLIYAPKKKIKFIFICKTGRAIGVNTRQKRKKYFAFRALWLFTCSHYYTRQKELFCISSFVTVYSHYYTRQKNYFAFRALWLFTVIIIIIFFFSVGLFSHDSPRGPPPLLSLYKINLSMVLERTSNRRLKRTWSDLAFETTREFTLLWSTWRPEEKKNILKINGLLQT